MDTEQHQQGVLANLPPLDELRPEPRQRRGAAAPGTVEHGDFHRHELDPAEGGVDGVEGENDG